jgi:hypothetical protein
MSAYLVLAFRKDGFHRVYFASRHPSITARREMESYPMVIMSVDLPGKYEQNVQILKANLAQHAQYDPGIQGLLGYGDEEIRALIPKGVS